MAPPTQRSLLALPRDQLLALAKPTKAQLVQLILSRGRVSQRGGGWSTDGTYNLAELFDNDFFNNSTLLVAPQLTFKRCTSLHELVVILHNSNLLKEIIENVAQNPAYVNGFTPLSDAWLVHTKISATLTNYFRQIDAWARRCAETINNLSPIHKSVIRLYSMDYGYVMLNFDEHKLRAFIDGNGWRTNDFILLYNDIMNKPIKMTDKAKPWTDAEFESVVFPEVFAALRSCSDALNAVFEHMIPCPGMYVFRGIKGPLRVTGDAWMSTSLDASLAERFGSGGGDMGSSQPSEGSVMRIRIQGIKCIPLYKCEVMRREEYEVLLQQRDKMVYVGPLSPPLLKYNGTEFGHSSPISELGVKCDDYSLQTETDAIVSARAPNPFGLPETRYSQTVASAPTQAPNPEDWYQTRYSPSEARRAPPPPAYHPPPPAYQNAPLPSAYRAPNPFA